MELHIHETTYAYTTFLFLSIYILTLCMHAPFSWATQHTTICLDTQSMVKTPWETQHSIIYLVYTCTCLSGVCAVYYTYTCMFFFLL